MDAAFAASIPPRNRFQLILIASSVVGRDDEEERKNGGNTGVVAVMPFKAVRLAKDSLSF